MGLLVEGHWQDQWYDTKKSGGSFQRDLHAQPGISGTVNFQHIKGHYDMSHPTINPTRIVPVGPETDWNAPAIRARGTQFA